MIELVPFTENDYDELIGWIDSEELMYSWSGSLFCFPLTGKSLEWYIAGSNNPFKSDAFIFKVIDKATGISIGHISLGGLSWKNRSARITRVLVGHPDFKRKGYCKLMVQSACDFGFEKLNLHRIGLGVYEQNAGALQCYTKAGFMQEGIHRDVFFHEGNFWSIIEMGILKSEWEAKKLSIHF